MAGLELFADDIDGRLHVAVVKNGVLDDLYTDTAAGSSNAGGWGAFYLGKVLKIDTKLNAAFVDIGNGLTGFLPAKHVRHPGSDESESRTGISSLLTGGQMIVVQVKSEGKRASENENQKLPRLTMKLYVPGLFLTYSPSSSRVTISRRVEDDKILAMTAKLKGKGGWIVRHHIEKASEAEIELEARKLLEAWQQIVEARAKLGDKPGLIAPGPSALVRAVTDYGTYKFDHIYAGNKRILDQMIQWCNEHLPSLAESKRLRLFKPEKPNQQLFDIHDLHTALESLKDERVYLEGGATIIIEPASALTLIDVNQGASASISAANQSAVPEIARHCRLRNISGAILADFINLEQKDERARLQSALTEAFTNDMAGAQVHGFTRLGLVEITRKRRTATYAEKQAN